MFYDRFTNWQINNYKDKGIRTISIIIIVQINSEVLFQISDRIL